MPEESPEDFDSICPPELRSLLKCVFCKNDLTEEAVQITGAKLTVCFHSVCQQCAEGWKDIDTKFCPECDIPVCKDLVEHKLLQELVEKPHSDATQKGMCGSGLHAARPANRWCNECESLVCEECVKAHQMLQKTTKHKIVDASSILPKSLVQFNCELHPTKQLEIFCGKCEVMTCRDCQLVNHKQHNDYEFIDVLCKEYKKELIKTQERLCQSQKTMEDSLKAAQLLQNDLQSKKKMLHKEINELHQKIIQILDERFKNLLNYVDTAIDEDVQDIVSKMAKTTQKLAPLNHCVQIIDLMLLHASDNTVFFSKKHMEKCLKVLLQGKIEAPNPDVKKNFSFNPGDNIKLLLEQIGKITDIGQITCETKNLGDKEMYRPIFKHLKLTGGEGTKVEKPTPARIQLRQDLQSPESRISVERVSCDSRASASPEGGMPHWHTPQEPPKLTSPARSVPSYASSLSLKGLLATTKPPLAQATSTSYTHTPVPNLQRNVSQEAPRPPVQYVMNGVPQQQMQSVGMQPAPAPYYGTQQPDTSRVYPGQSAAGSRRQNQAPISQNVTIYQDMLGSNGVSLTPTSTFQQAAQSQQQQQSAIQVQSMQMQQTLNQHAAHAQSMQMQTVPSPVLAQSMHLQSVHLQTMQHLDHTLHRYIPGSTHSPYNEM